MVNCESPPNSQAGEQTPRFVQSRQIFILDPSWRAMTKIDWEPINKSNSIPYQRMMASGNDYFVGEIFEVVLSL